MFLGIFLPAQYVAPPQGPCVFWACQFFDLAFHMPWMRCPARTASWGPSGRPQSRLACRLISCGCCAAPSTGSGLKVAALSVSARNSLSPWLSAPGPPWPHCCPSRHLSSLSCLSFSLCHPAARLSGALRVCGVLPVAPRGAILVCI